jgi:predicted DNA-binding transcriptional regulator YafY
MRRAERALQVLQILRRKRITTAAEIAEEMEVAKISVYRYMRDLEAMGVPIEAERGAGYRLRSYDIPGWYTKEEVQALPLGLNTAKVWGADELAAAASSALAKIGAALPDELKPSFEEVKLTAKLPWDAPTIQVDLGVIRQAVVEKTKLRLDYKNEQGKRSQRVVNPMELRLYPPWVLIAWCESREDVRGG